jgi:hypothetical protein
MAQDTVHEDNQHKCKKKDEQRKPYKKKGINPDVLKE